MMTVEAPPERAGIEVDLEGAALLTNPLLNKDTAFTENERTTFALHGLRRPHVGTLDNQLTRQLQAVRKFDHDLDRYVFRRGLLDANETLFYAQLTHNLGEMAPLVYTPTVG
jgi:malate dehydrogenase (oxaloacetate-decarboxylating)